MDANSVTAFAASVTAGAFIVYTFVTWRLWQQTKRQAQTAERRHHRTADVGGCVSAVAVESSMGR